jgi:hypothetical protein
MGAMVKDDLRVCDHRQQPPHSSLDEFLTSSVGRRRIEVMGENFSIEDVGRVVRREGETDEEYEARDKEFQDSIRGERRPRAGELVTRIESVSGPSSVEISDA